MDHNVPSASRDSANESPQNSASKSRGAEHLEDVDKLKDRYLTARMERPIRQTSMGYPYFLMTGKLASFPFSRGSNKQYDKTLTLQMGSFQPTTSPREDWATFVNNVWKHLAPFRSQGIASVQYELTLKPHFTEQVLVRIHGDMVQVYIEFS